MKYYLLKLIAALMISITAVAVCHGYAYPSDADRALSADAAEVAQFLAKSNVIIDPKLIDDRAHLVYECEMQNEFTDKKESAKLFLGEAIEEKNGAYVSANGRVLYSDEGRLSYIPESPKFASMLSDISPRNADKKAKQICAKLGIDTSSCNFGISAGSDRTTVSVMPMIKGRPVYNDALILEMSNAGLHSITGVWYSAAKAHSEKYVKSASYALRYFMSNYADTRVKTEITDMQLGYNLTNVSSQESAVKPVWKITVANSAVYYIDAASEE